MIWGTKLHNTFDDDWEDEYPDGTQIIPTLDEYFDKIEEEYKVDNDDEVILEKGRNEKGFYLTSEEILTECEKSKTINQPTPELIQMFFQIAEGVKPKLKKADQDTKNACVNYAVTRCWEKKWLTYDINRSKNLFSYFTTVIINDMKTYRNYINSHSNRHISFETINLD